MEGIGVAIMVFVTGFLNGYTSSKSSPAPQNEIAAVCFLEGEREPVASSTKVCTYDCRGNLVATTIKFYEHCPSTIHP